MSEGKTPEDFIKEANEENKRINNPPPSEGNFSKAAFSSITHPDEDDRRKKIAQGIIAELGNHTNEIDSIKQAIKTMSEQMNQLTQAFNQLANGTPQGQTQLGPAKGLNMESIEVIGNLIEKGTAAYKSLKGEAPQASLIDQNMINEKMVKGFMDNLETGEAITNFIKQSLKKNVTKQIINTSLADMGKDDHQPQ